MSTKPAPIAERARKHPQEGLTLLHPYLTKDALRESYRQLRKKAAAGIDGKTTEAYGREIEQRLPDLIAEIKTGRY